MTKENGPVKGRLQLKVWSLLAPTTALATLGHDASPIGPNVPLPSRNLVLEHCFTLSQIRVVALESRLLTGLRRLALVALGEYGHLLEVHLFLVLSGLCRLDLSLEAQFCHLLHRQVNELEHHFLVDNPTVE
jgi:hypothetical protein